MSSNHCDVCGITFASQKIYEGHMKYSPRHHSPQSQKQPQPRQPRQPPPPSQKTHIPSPSTQKEKPKWSIIPFSESQAVLEALVGHVHSEETLRESKIIMQPFDPEDYVGRMKCVNCNRKEEHAVGGECCWHPKRLARVDPKDPNGVRLWLCCNSVGEGCQKKPEHNFQHGIQYKAHQDFLPTPPASPENRKFQAVVLDCEMAGVASGAGEAILLVVTDYVSGAVIINKYVSPPEPITMMRSSVHGVSRRTLDNAIRRGEALNGWKGAREELWRYVDSSTILIGHALENDLNTLRLIHPRIVDSGILAKKAIDVSWRSFGLALLCEELLGVGFREGRGQIHDCLEDVLATREVVLFCTRRREEFRVWAAGKKVEEMKRREEEKKKNEEAREAKKKAEEEKKSEKGKKEALAVKTSLKRAELKGLVVST